MSVKCTASIGIDSSLEVKICLDDALKHVLAVLDLKVSDKGVNLEKVLEELRNIIKQCCGEEFNLVKLNSKPGLVKVIIATEEGMDKSILDTSVKLLEDKLKKCELGNKINEILSKYCEKKQTSRTRGSRRKSS
ncbi:MAG: hypothetical protein GXO23_03435 [Crenarchaeota archaeon]|nr:hypothetical protein [Thermoproteota archaeon]